MDQGVIHGVILPVLLTVTVSPMMRQILEDHLINQEANPPAHRTLTMNHTHLLKRMRDHLHQTFKGM